MLRRMLNLGDVLLLLFAVQLNIAAATHFVELATTCPFQPASTAGALAPVEVALASHNETVRDLRRYGEEGLLRRRSGSCGNYNSCSSLGAPSLCCPQSQICSADQLGHVGCCPQGAACTGIVTSSGAGGVVATQGATTTITRTPSTITSTPATATVVQTTSTPGGFVVAGSSTVVVFGQGPPSQAHGLRVPATFAHIAFLFRLFFR